MDPLTPDTWLPALELCRDRPGSLLVWRTDLPLRFDPLGEFHQIPCLCLCLAGTSRLVRQDAHCDLAVGDALVMEPGVWHRHEPLVGEAACLHLGFTANWCDVWVKTRAWWRVWRLPYQPLRTTIEALLTAASDEKRRHHARRLLAAIASRPRRQLNAADRPLWSMLGGVWRLAYDEAVSAGEILRKSRLSRAQAYRRFTAFYGVGPARAIEVMRLDLARWLLFRGCGVGEVAGLSGFPTRHAFTKRWVAQFAAPPRGFRGRLAPLPARGYRGNAGRIRRLRTERA
jgi:AraC-like DNA-binding protein